MGGVPVYDYKCKLMHACSHNKPHIWRIIGLEKRQVIELKRACQIRICHLLMNTIGKNLICSGGSRDRMQIDLVLKHLISVCLILWHHMELRAANEKFVSIITSDKSQSTRLQHLLYLALCALEISCLWYVHLSFTFILTFITISHWLAPFPSVQMWCMVNDRKSHQRWIRQKQTHQMRGFTLPSGTTVSKVPVWNVNSSTSFIRGIFPWFCCGVDCAKSLLEPTCNSHRDNQMVCAALWGQCNNDEAVNLTLSIFK